MTIARFDFDPKLLLGVENIDDEHRALLDLASRIDHALSAGDRAIDEALALIIELRGEMAKHFLNEEALMAKAGYSGLSEHQAEHHRLLLHGSDIEMQATMRDRYSPGELALFIHKWLVGHMEVDDKKFGEFMARQYAK
jgi:hemerythrin-like metal-binding protein